MSVFTLFSGVFRATRSISLKPATFAVLLSLKLASVFTEILGFSIFGPLLEFIENGKAVPERSSFNIFWVYLRAFFDFFGVQISLASLLFSILVVLFARQAIGFFHRYMEGVVKAQALKTVVDKAVVLALGSKIDYLFSFSRGKFLNDITREADRCVTGVLKSISLLSHFCLFMAYVGLLCAVVGDEVFYVLLGCLLLMACFRPVMVKSRNMSQQITAHNRASVDNILHILEAIRFVKLNNRECSEFEKVKYATAEIFLSQKKLAKFSASLSFGLEPLVLSAATIFIFYNVEYLNTPVSELAIVSLYALRLLPIMKEILPGIQAVYGVQSSTSAVNEVLDGLANNQEDTLSGKILGATPVSIVMDGVAFKFPNSEKYLFENFNYAFEAGNIYCIVGRSGVGKSTLVELLPSLRHSSKGRIYISGQNIKDLNIKSLRDKITFCSCDPRFLGMSIRNFIMSDNLDVDQKLIDEAVNGLGLRELIDRLPDGLDSEIKDQADDFSSGQKQRVEIARAMLSSKPIVIFDEPTTNLDRKNIDRFTNLISKSRYKSGKIVIIISHDSEISGFADHTINLN
jgi:ABC-type bacteriocin/lantibiotic exporter with double-glycine peptidase domain